MSLRERSRLSAWVPLACVVLSFTASRMLARAVLGLRFDWSSLTYFLQYPTISMLRDDLLRTVFYMHHQAPLPSLVAGLAMKVAPSHYVYLLDAFNCGLGLIMAIAMLEILRRLGVSAIARTLAVAIYTATPPVIVYEMWLFYHQLVVALLVVSIWAALLYAERPTVRRGLLLFFILAAVAYARSIYGAVWLGVAIAVTVVVLPGVRRRTLLTAAIPFAFVLLLPLKTKLETGGGYGDAILWPNLATKMIRALPTSVHEKLAEDGALSKVAHVEPFSRLDVFEKAAGERLAGPKHGVPVLDAREHGGQLNKQHVGYLEIAQRWSKSDAKVLLGRYPGAYLRASVTALTVNAMRPSLEDITLNRSPNDLHMRGPDRVMRRLIGVDRKGRIVPLLYLAPLAVAFGAWTFLRRSAGVVSQRPMRLAITLATLTIGYTSLGTAFVSYDDFSRYRFEVDALYMIIWTVLASRAASAVLFAWRERRSRRRSVRERLAVAS